MDYNTFADMGKDMSLMSIPTRFNESQYVSGFPTSPKPLSDQEIHVDWRDKGMVSHVVTQGKCGLCWGIAAVDAFNSLAAKRGGNRVPYSIQQILDCVSPEYTCESGGSSLKAFEYIRDNKMCTYEDYPYVQEKRGWQLVNVVLLVNVIVKSNVTIIVSDKLTSSNSKPADSSKLPYLAFRQEHESAEAWQQRFPQMVNALGTKCNQYIMKINTISAYALVYLLARGHWNLIVPVRADGEGDGSSGSPASHADGSTASTPADASSALTTSTPTTGTGSKPPSRASSKAGSTSGSTAGSRASSTAGSRAGSVADLTSLTPEDPSSTLTAPPANEGTGADAGLTVSTGADGSVASSDASTDPTLASGEPAKTETEFGSLFPGEGGDSVEYTPGLFEAAEAKAALDTKKSEAKRLAEQAKKAADDATKAAEEMTKAAEALSQAIEKAESVESLSAEMIKLTATVDAKVYELNVEKTKLNEVATPPDMMYYGGFPNGHHHMVDHESLIRMYKIHNWTHNTLHYSGFPDGWHAANLGGFDAIAEEAKKYRDNKYEEDREAKRKQITDKEGEITAKDGQIVAKEGEMAKKKEALEDKNEELDAKKLEVSEMRAVIAELQRQLRALETQAATLNSEHSKLFAEFKLLEVDHRKLADEKAKLVGERETLVAEDRKLVDDYIVLNEKLAYVYGSQFSSIYENHFPSASFTHPGLEFDEPAKSGEGEAKAESAEAGSAAPTSEDAGKTAGEPAEASSTVPAPEDSGAKPAEGAAPATHVTPVKEETAPATHVTPAKAEPAKEPAKEATKEPAKEAAKKETAPATHVTPAKETAPAAKEPAKAPAKGAAPAVLRLFKAEADGTEVEMLENTDFTKKLAYGDDKYEFASGVKCTKVMFGDHELWKKGDEGVNEPVNVTYRDTLSVVVVRDNEHSVSYKKNTLTDKWAHDTTTKRTVPARNAQTASQGSSTAKSVIGTGTPSARTGLVSPGLARGSAGGSTTNLHSASSMGGSTTNLTASSMMGLSTSTQSLTTIEETSEPKSGTGTLRGASH
ncbi:hypothetical protein MACJ_002577 [Theileria orientalis]|uniref:Peptidase C1A papain C-terminal domain-containing protein n=1 Tax=Theileria orientalis TaxID=68886 RepID=A0A976QVL2_THEOR|nr:hypothetical protein MACJ_002577 [Theileria orientalis]